MTEEIKIKLIKTLKGAAIAGGGVAVTYFLQALTQIDFGSYTPIVVGISSVLINALKEIMRTYNPQ